MIIILIVWCAEHYKWMVESRGVGQTDGGSLPDTLSYIRQHNHCGSSLKELCHCTSLNLCALMTLDGILLLVHQKSAKHLKMNRHHRASILNFK